MWHVPHDLNNFHRVSGIFPVCLELNHVIYWRSLNGKTLCSFAVCVLLPQGNWGRGGVEREKKGARLVKVLGSQLIEMSRFISHAALDCIAHSTGAVQRASGQDHNRQIHHKQSNKQYIYYIYSASIVQPLFSPYLHSCFKNSSCKVFAALSPAWGIPKIRLANKWISG